MFKIVKIVKTKEIVKIVKTVININFIMNKNLSAWKCKIGSGAKLGL
jgi:hypothetical protein